MVSVGGDVSVVPNESKGKQFGKCLLQNWFMLTTIIGVVIGFGAGFGIQKVGLDETGRTWIDMPGTLYIRLLKLTILPMIASNIINVMANLNPRENGKVSMMSLGYILFFNLISACIGVIYGVIIQPGKSVIRSTTASPSNVTDSGNQISYIFRDLFLNIFPDNIVGVTLFQTSADFDNPQLNANNEIVYPTTTTDGTNMIGLLFVSLVFGIAANATREKGEAFKGFFASFGEVIMLLMQKFLLVTPVGVMFMVMSSIATVEDIEGTFISLGYFLLLNVVGFLTHFIFVLMSLVILCRNPFRILRYSFPMYFLSFATTSPIVALPKGYIACDKYGIPEQISRFVLPLAGTMKADGPAVFIAGSCMFVAQQQNVDLNAAKLIIIIILTFAYASALPNIPSSSVVAVITILGSIGVDPSGASLLYAVEWITDRLRSGNAGVSHLFCAAFAYHVVEKDFVKEDVDSKDVLFIEDQSDSLKKE